MSGANHTQRSFMVRVTRHPLDPVLREQMRCAGTLPDDYRSRSITATDFVKVNADDDADAIVQAQQQTTLVFRGEAGEYHEALAGGGYRPLNPNTESAT